VARLLDRQRREQTTENVRVAGTLRKRLAPLSSPILSLASVSNQVWCGTRDGTLTVVSAESGDEMRTFTRAHAGAINAVSEIQGKVWSVGDDGKVCVWKPDEIGHDVGLIKLKEGMLQLGEKKLFRGTKAQWFVLYKQGCLEVFKCAGSAELVDTVDLTDASIECYPKKPLRFTIKTLEKPLTLQAKTELEAHEWIEELKLAITSASGKVLELDVCTTRAHCCDCIVCWCIGGRH
jgi:hypothetical protein